MRDDNLGISLISSIAIHVCAILIVSVALQTMPSHEQNYFPIHLIELPESANLPPKFNAPAETKVPPRSAQKAETPKETRAPVIGPVIKPERPLPSLAATKPESVKSPEVKTAASVHTESPPSSASNTHEEDGGSAAGTGSSFSKGDVGVVAGTGTGAGGGGAAASGLGRGAGAPRLPSQTVLRTNREAKPIQTARANYPPMALRMGMESDVTLKIEVDAEGKVTKAEITKSGGSGFDEEAFKAVQQSRFEPAQKDGHNVPAEFTYVYRFRLKR